jgi:hypothetical protein
VDLGEGAGDVVPLGKGSELAQLDGSARQWNGGVSDDGKLWIS